MKMLKRIVIVVVVLIAAVLIYAATKPDSFQVQRAATIKARPEKIFTVLNDFHAWGTWSPWEKMDPDMKRSFSGAASGKGSVYEWNGNKKVGQGRMEIAESTPASKLVIKLDFLKPFEAHNTTEFTLTPKGDATELNWIMTGPNLYIGKVMSVFLDMDSMIGKDFETGLANLKAATEK